MTSIRQIINNEDDLGEVAEWVEKSAAQKCDDDEFEEAHNFQTAEEKLHIEEARKKINKKLAQKGSNLSRRSGPLVNNLRDKAKMMAIQNTSITQEPKVEYGSSDEEEQPAEKGEESPDGKIFRLSQRSLGSEKNLEFEQANKEYILDVQQKPKEVMNQITFVEAWDALKTSRELKNSIQFKQKKVPIFQKLFGCFTVHLKNTRLIQEKDQVCLLTQLQFDDNNPTHFRILFSIFCQFMNTDYCLRYGSHWESIGFQGRDPATDLRGAGLLGLLQILAFLENYKIFIKQSQELAESLHFPLSITLINITTFVLIALKDNKLNALINKEDSVLSVVNKLYFAGFSQFFKMYKLNGNFNTIGSNLDLVRQMIYESPDRLIKEFAKDIQKFYKLNN